MFKRTLTIRNPEDQPHGSVYALVLSAFRDTIEALLPDLTEDCTDWPNINWSGQRGSLYAYEWVAEENPNNRLLTLQLQLAETTRTWHLSLSLGCTSADEAVWQEECSIDPVPPQFPMLDMPSLCTCLSAFICYDLDGMRTGRTYTVGKANLDKLKSFLTASGQERKLPVVLVSPQAGRFPYALEYRMLARFLNGVAHVMRLDAGCGWAINAVSPVHGCYNGAVRIYWPGYTQKDNVNVHPYWRPVEHKLRSEDQVELLSQLATYSAATLPEHSLFAELKRRQQDEQRDREARAAIELIERRYQTRKEGEREEYFETLHAEYNSILAERDSLRKDNERLSDENRKLKYRINEQWGAATATVLDGDDICPHPTMSDRAADTYLYLDPSEQEKVDSLLEKLLQAELRKQQSEVEHFTDGGTCYIYPRGHNNTGKRILYLLNDAEVRICEIYTRHDAYEKMRNKGWRESDYLSATPWSLPAKAKDSPQIPLPM